MVALAIMNPLTYLRTPYMIFWTSNLQVLARKCPKIRYFGYIWRLKVHFELKLPVYLVFIVALAIMNPFTCIRTPYTICLYF